MFIFILMFILVLEILSNVYSYFSVEKFYPMIISIYNLVLKNCIYSKIVSWRTSLERDYPTSVYLYITHMTVRVRGSRPVTGREVICTAHAGISSLLIFFASSRPLYFTVSVVGVSERAGKLP